MNQFDLALSQWLNSWAGITGLWDFFIISCGEYLIWLLVATLFLLPLAAIFKRFSYARAKNAELFLFALGSGLVARYGIAEIIRFFYDRPRPFEILDLVQLINHAGGSSFPSGHVSFAFAAATAVAFYYPRASIVFFLAAVSIGLGRVAAGIHWPSDIFGGALVGIGTALLLRYCLLKSINKITT